MRKFLLTHLHVENVQLAKLAGNKVVATCGGKDKATLLKQLGVDRVIDYRSEDVKTVCFENHFKFFMIFFPSFIV